MRGVNKKVFVVAQSLIDKKLRRPKYNKAISKILAIGLLIIVCVVIGVGAYYAFFALPAGPTPTPTPKPTETPTETPESQKPDLDVVSIEIFPSQPKVKNYFYAVAYVENIGDGVSGYYDVSVSIKDISRVITYSIGTYSQHPLNPSEQFVVWIDDIQPITNVGAHQLWVEIIPLDFEDGDDSNNVYGEQFTIIP